MALARGPLGCSTVDRNVIKSRNPGDLEAFSKKIKLLKPSPNGTANVARRDVRSAA